MKFPRGSAGTFRSFGTWRPILLYNLVLVDAFQTIRRAGGQVDSSRLMKRTDVRNHRRGVRRICLFIHLSWSASRIDRRTSRGFANPSLRTTNSIAIAPGFRVRSDPIAESGAKIAHLGQVGTTLTMLWNITIDGTFGASLQQTSLIFVLHPLEPQRCDVVFSVLMSSSRSDTE